MARLGKKRSLFDDPSPQVDNTQTEYRLDQETDGVEPARASSPAPTDTAQATSPQPRTAQTDQTKTDRNESRSYSLPRSVHDRLAEEAIRRSATEGKRISTSKLLLELIEKGLK